MAFNPNSGNEIRCSSCGKQTAHHGKAMCQKCYKKQWKPKLIICKECKKERPHHAFGLCNSCHTKLYHYNNVKASNYRKWHGIDLQTYRNTTKACLICGFDKVVDLHHLDGDHKNNKQSNLIGLCPNHHKMYHNQKYRKEVELAIKEVLKSKIALK